MRQTACNKACTLNLDINGLTHLTSQSAFNFCLVLFERQPRVVYLVLFMNHNRFRKLVIQ